MRKKYTHIRCPFFARTRSSTLFPVAREITRIRKVYKRTILDSNRECTTSLLFQLVVKAASTIENKWYLSWDILCLDE